MKLSKKILSFSLCIIMIIGSITIGGEGFAEVLENISLKASAYSTGDYIYFGTYPQSEVTDSALISNLNGVGGSWKSYGYYSGDGARVSTSPSDYMRYKDVSYKGDKYRAVTFDSYRPNFTEDPCSSDYSYQDNNGYTTGNVYWFKYEPIKWRVLDQSTGLVMCATIIDSQEHNNFLYSNGGGVYNYFNDSNYTNFASDYVTSSIRQWLNTDFYNTAFSFEQKSNIITSSLNNDGYCTLTGITGHERLDSASTSDKVFLLSYDEVLNSKYGFSTSYNTYDSARQLKGSDYAKCQGIYVCSSFNSSYDGCSSWWLRSPGSWSYYKCGVIDNGFVYNGIYGDGVVPAMRLSNLKSDYAGSESGSAGSTNGSTRRNDKTETKNQTTAKAKTNSTSNTVICSDGSKRKFNKSFEKIVMSHSSSEYNPELADLLMSFSSASYNEEYVYQSLLNFEFDKNSIKTGNAYSSMAWYNVAYSIATKKTSSGDTIVFIPIRGTSDAVEWVSDLCILKSTNGLHEGFNLAAIDVMANLKKYLGSNFSEKSSVKYVLTGHSRGAAVANLVAKKLVDAGVPQSNVYDYNYACPDVVWYGAMFRTDHIGANEILPTISAQPSPDKYTSIFNINNSNDLVSYVPGHICSSTYRKWGKFGKSYWFIENGWDSKPNVGLSAHSSDKYLKYMHKEKDIKTYYNLSEIKDWLYHDLSFWETVKDWVVVGIFCPVSVEVLCDGRVVAKIDDKSTDGIGSVENNVFVSTDGDKKLITFPNNGEYEIKLIGTDSGKMNYSVQYYEFLDDEIKKEYAYNDINLEKGKLFEDVVGTETMQSRLLVLDDNNKPIYEVTSDGTEIECNDSKLIIKDYFVYIILIVLALIMIIILIISLIKRNRKQPTENKLETHSTAVNNLPYQLIPNGTHGICQKCKNETDNIFTFKIQKNDGECSAQVCEICGKALVDVVRKRNMQNK